MINNALLGNVNSNPIDSTILDAKGEEYQVIHSYQNSHSHLSSMINNALLGNVNSNSIDSISTDNVKEQFITIKQDEYNENMIFEETQEKGGSANLKCSFYITCAFSLTFNLFF